MAWCCARKIEKTEWYIDAAYEEYKEFMEKFSWIEQKFDSGGFLIIGSFTQEK